jgi:acetyltransferase-like isoleucine patch superfamily enzyme
MKKFKLLFKRLFWSLERQAKDAGVKMGKENFIASRFWSSEPYLISIGSHCAITAGVKLFTHGGSRVLRYKYPKFDSFGKVTIGDYVYLGNNVLVMPGVEIGNHVLVAAGSVVTKSIPSDCVVAGNPAKYICSIQEYEEKNIKYNTNSKGMDAVSKKELLLSLGEEKFIKKSRLQL